jgi:protein-tyrosine phosphatase
MIIMGLLSWIRGLIFRGPPPGVASGSERPAKWAKKVDVVGAFNAFWVEDGVLMRSSQPTAHGLGELKEKHGIKTIVSLRTTMSDAGLAKPGTEVIYKIEDEDFSLERAMSDVKLAGLRLVHIWFHPVYPTEHQVSEFVRLVGDKANQPVLVHCRHGSDRTGTMCAAYRIVVQGWTKEEAIEEMTHGGYGFHYKYFQNLVFFLKSMHVERVRKNAGI